MIERIQQKIKQLVKIRMFYFNANFETTETDVYRGVRINQDHLIKVLEARAQLTEDKN